MRVGDVRVAEANIHAAIKCVDILMTKYFSDAQFKKDDRLLFALASYNAAARDNKLSNSKAKDAATQCADA